MVSGKAKKAFVPHQELTLGLAVRMSFQIYKSIQDATSNFRLDAALGA